MQCKPIAKGVKHETEKISFNDWRISLGDWCNGCGVPLCYWEWGCTRNRRESCVYYTTWTSLNQEFTIPVTVFPENATNKEVTWKSTNPDFVTVDEHTGLIKCVQEGQAGLTLIIVTSKDGEKTSVCYVSVPDHL